MIEIYGSSDDLIEIEGDIREEFNDYGGNGYLYFSDEVVIKYDYDGDWTFSIKSNPKNIKIEIKEVGKIDKEKYNDYSQLVKIEDNVSWVKKTKNFNSDMYSEDVLAFLKRTKEEYIESGEELYGDDLEKLFDDIIHRVEKLKNAK
jgi:hypothetical protein